MKKIILLLTFCSILFTNAFSQQVKIDSLKQVINSNAADTIKIKTYLLLGKIYRGTVLDSALFFYREALSIAEENEEKKLTAQSLKDIGVVYFYQNNFSKTIEYWGKAVIINEEIGDQKERAINIGNIGLACYYQNDYLNALEYHHKALKINKKIDDLYGIAGNLVNIGIVYFDQGNYPKALEYNKRALKINEEIGSQLRIALSLLNIGNVYNQESNYYKALEYYQKALNINKLIDNQEGITANLGNIGLVYYYQNNFPKALEYHQKALKINEELENQAGVSVNLGNIGHVFNQQGNHLKSLEYYQKALKIDEELGSKSGISAGLGYLGVVYWNQGNYVKALEYYQKALKIDRDIGDQSSIADKLGKMGVVYLDQGNYSKALEYHQKSLKIHKEIGYQLGISNNYRNIGAHYNRKKEYSKAIDYLKKALKINQEIGVEDAFNYQFLSVSYWALKDEKIAAHYFDTLHNLNNKNILLNFTILPESAKQLYFTGVEQDYWRYNSFALNNGDSFPAMYDRVYNSTVKNKGLLLKSNTAMRNAIYSSKDSTLIEAYDYWIVLKTQLAEKYANGEDATKLNNKADSLEGSLVKNSNEFSDFKKTQNIDWKQVQNGLSKGEVAIEFTHFPLLNPDSSFVDFTNEIQYVALVINKKSIHPQMIPLFKEKQLEEVIGKFGGNNFSYINGIYGTQKNENNALYNLIWKPLEKQVAGAKKVFLSPSGLLHKISFPAISKSKNVYLCDAYNIEVKSSTGKIIDEGNRKQELNTASLFGGVDYDTENSDLKNWKYLEGTKIEADNISKILTKGKLEVNYFSSSEATEDKFKETSSSSNILHIATHGFFYPDPNKIQEETGKSTEVGEIIFRGDSGYGINSFIENRNPLMRSGLVLAGANDVWTQQEKNDSIEDGVLTAQEVSNIDLRKTELVVMSACESGLGDIQGSEGVYGLQRSFKMAGVDFIIMSLWQVPDKETEEFMTSFYKKLTKYKDIERAFSNTQKEMRKKYDPYFWAAFVLVE